MKILKLLILFFLLSKSITLQANSDDKHHIIATQQNINNLLQIAEQEESNGNYYKAYEYMVKAADLSYENNLYQYATEIYIRGLNLRMKYEEIFPSNFENKNRPYLNLCRLLQQSITDEAIYWHDKAIKHCEMDNDTSCKLKAMMSYALYYTNVGEDEKALKVIEDALPIAENHHNKFEYARILLDYSDLLNKLGKYALAMKKAEEGHKLMINHEKKLSLKDYKWSLFFIELKAFIYHTKGNYEKAEQYYLAAIDSVKAIRSRGGNKHDDIEYVTSVRLGKLYYETEKHQKANVLFNNAVALRNKAENQAFNAKFLYDTMIEAFENAKDYKKAHEASEAYRAFINNSYISALKQQNQSQRDLAVLNIQNTQKEISLIKEQAERASKNNQIILLTIGLLAFGVVAATLIVVNRQKQKNNQSLINKNELISEQKNQITSSIEYAEKIQNALLPSREIMQEAFPESFVFYLPRDIVSGDFYWMHPFEEGVLLACADCTGHGVPGAIVSMLGNNGLNNSVNDHKLKSPHQILNRLNAFIEKTFSKSKETIYDGMDIALIAYHPKEQTVKFSGANIPLYIVRNKELIVLKPDKQPIGKFDHHKPFTEQTINVEKGDMVYMFSDGLQDQFGGPRNKKFKVGKLKKLLVEMAPMEIPDQLETLSMRFFDWKGECEQVDDLCFIALRIS